MNIVKGWVRIAPRNEAPYNLCPVCQHDHWCMMQADESAVICGRVAEGFDKDLGDAGYLFRLKKSEGGRFHSPPEEWWLRHKRESEAHKAVTDFAEHAARCRRALSNDALEMLALGLGVMPLTLQLLGVGWNGRAYTFPMSLAGGRVVGIRLRGSDGKKWAEKGSTHGLFIPEVRSDGPLLVCEGPTDTAALLGLGYDAVGRPSCRGCEDQVVSLARPLGQPRRDVVIVADDDGPGFAGAAKLADMLVPKARSVKVITPQGRKDAREWVREGATRELVDRVINNAWEWEAAA